MSSLAHPADYSVAELKEALEDVDDVERLERLLERERADDDRVTAIDAIEQRLETVESAADGHEENENDESARDADESARDADESSDESNGDTIEEGWSKDTGVSRDDRSVTERSETPSDETSVERARNDRTLERDRSARVAENGESAHERLDVSSKRTEVLSLPRTDAAADEHVGERLLENIERIRHTFEDANDTGGRMEARIRQLQADVGDLKSYTNALEEFLDEEGTGRQVIESVRSDLTTLESALADVTDDVQVHGRNLATLWDVVEDVESELSRLHERLERQHRDLTDVTDDVEGVERVLDEMRETAAQRNEAHVTRFESVDETLTTHGDALADLDGAVTSVDERVDAVAEETASVVDRVDTVATNVRTLEEEVDERMNEGSAEYSALTEQLEHNTQAIEELSTEVGEIAAAVEALEALVGDSGHVDQRFDAIEAEIQDLHEWREQLSSVLLSSANGEPNPAD